MPASPVAIARFLSSIGLEATLQPGATGFVDGVQLQSGALLIDPAAPASAILHEAGHLAVMPPAFRHYLSGDLDVCLEQVFDAANEPAHRDDEALQRKLLQASEAEATAWAWAAGVHLGLPHDEIIQDHEYDGTGAEVRTMLASNGYLGINGLAHAGFCSVRKRAGVSLPCYPKLAYWLQI